MTPYQSLRAVVEAGAWPWAPGQAVERTSIGAGGLPQTESAVVCEVEGQRLTVWVVGDGPATWAAGDAECPLYSGVIRTTLPDLTDDGTALTALHLLGSGVEPSWVDGLLEGWETYTPQPGGMILPGPRGHGTGELAVALYHHLVARQNDDPIPTRVADTGAVETAPLLGRGGSAVGGTS